jgi:sarcosine oxidase delta subunit
MYERARAVRTLAWSAIVSGRHASLDLMRWDELPKPDGVGEIRSTDDGFETSISIPLDETGYFGRECPSCEGPFKMRKDEYEDLPDELELTCPYCGHHEEHSAFMSSAQRERVMAAARGLAEQYIHRELNETLGRTFGSGQPRRSSGSFISIETSYTRGVPPPVRALPEILEGQTRRVVECSSCSKHHAVYSATAFCPVCGPRPAAEKVLEAIGSAHESLAVEDHVDEAQRETLRGAGVFERFAVDAIESVVSLFEMFAREQFEERVANAADLIRGRGNVFQRLDDTASLFQKHADIDLIELAGEDRWERLRQAFARRHVLIHKGGIVDEKFVAAVSSSGLRVGQRLVIRRHDAEEALDDLQAVVSLVADR